MKTPQHMLVVIDHHEARVYDCDHKGEAPEKTTPHDPHHIRWHQTHKASHSKGQRAPDDPTYFKRMVEQMKGADEILLLGHGTGHSSSKLELYKYLSRHHHDIADHIVGVESVDHMTEPQLLAYASAYFAREDR